MNKTLIICPNCGTRLKVGVLPKGDETILTCPICKYKAKVSVYKASTPISTTPPPSVNGGAGLNSEPPTQILYQTQNNDPGQLRILETGQICPLRRGIQVLGRLADTSTADIKIGSSSYLDRYMSRQHVKIEVRDTPFGYEHILHEIGSTNIIQINDSNINREDIIKLRFGDRIVMGKTHFVFEKSNDESTRVM